MDSYISPIRLKNMRSSTARRNYIKSNSSKKSSSNKKERPNTARNYKIKSFQNKK